MIQFRKATLSDLPEMMALFEMGIQSLKKQGSPQWQNGYGPTREKSKKISINKKVISCYMTIKLLLLPL